MLSKEVVGVDVGIVTQSREKRTVGFAIPSNTVVRIANQLIKKIMRLSGKLKQQKRHQRDRLPAANSLVDH